MSCAECLDLQDALQWKPVCNVEKNSFDALAFLECPQQLDCVSLGAFRSPTVQEVIKEHAFSNSFDMHSCSQLRSRHQPPARLNRSWRFAVAATTTCTATAREG